MKISVIGNLGLDVVAAQVDRMPPPGTEVMIDTIDVRPGGSAGNTAMALAALGVRHELHASLGDDTTATLVRALLTEGGVDCSHLRTTPGTPTAVSIAVQSNRRDRGFLATDGHLRSYDRDSVPAKRSRPISCCSPVTSPPRRCRDRRRSRCCARSRPPADAPFSIPA